MTEEKKVGALAGLRVLDASGFLAGPYCSMLLADLGADVLKVERPGTGDETRLMGPPFVQGESASFLAINRNKRSVTLNLKHPRGRQLFLDLARQSDVVLENFRPGTMGGLGLDYAAVRTVNPAIIYCSISGFGQTGPYRERGGYDLVTQGMSGIMSATGERGGSPVKVGVPISDVSAGMFAALAILAAYTHRQRTGEGQYIDNALLDAPIALSVWESAMFFAEGTVAKPMGSAHRLSAPCQAFLTGDGTYITLAAFSTNLWPRFCGVIGRPELVEDPRFRTNAERMEHLDELQEILQAALLQRSSGEWLDALQEAGVPSGPIYTYDRVFADPQVLHRQMVVEVDHPLAGRTRALGVPMKLSATPAEVRTAAPTLGQHTDEVLSGLGLDAGELARLRAEKVI